MCCAKHCSTYLDKRVNTSCQTCSVDHVYIFPCVCSILLLMPVHFWLNLHYSSLLFMVLLIYFFNAVHNAFGIFACVCIFPLNFI